MDCSTTRNRNKHQGPLPPGNCLSCEKVLIVMLRIHVFCCLLSLLNSLNHKIIEKIRLWRISKGLEEGLASYLGEIDQGFICLSFEYLLGQSFQKFSGQIALVFNQTPSFWTFFFFFFNIFRCNFFCYSLCPLFFTLPGKSAFLYTHEKTMAFFCL